MYTKSIIDHQQGLEKVFNSIAPDQITINGKPWLELRDYYYVLEQDTGPERVQVEPPLPDEVYERAYIFKRTRQCFEFFKTDLNTRRAAFANQYDGFDNHCISYFHFLLRNGQLDLNVYVRSQNFTTNWLWDNYVYEDALVILHKLLTQAGTDCKLGHIIVRVASLHTLNERS